MYFKGGLMVKFNGVLALEEQLTVRDAVSPFKGGNEAEWVEHHKTDKNGCEGLSSGLARLQRDIDKQLAKNDLFKKIINEFQSNIKKSETLRAEILKGQLAGESTDILFIKAVECISLMTGDTAFYNQIKRKHNKA